MDDKICAVVGKLQQRLGIQRSLYNFYHSADIFFKICKSSMRASGSFLQPFSNFAKSARSL